MVLDINQKFISKLNYCDVVATASSLAEARSLIQATHIDLVLLDVFLPDGKGIDYLKWLRREEFDTDVLLITADKSAKSVEDAFRYGAVDYLVKPFKFERLQEVLAAYREKWEMTKQRELTQSQIDQINKIQKEGIVEDDDKDDDAINMTYQKIIQCIKDNDSEGITAQEVANCLGVSRVTARRYLEMMETSKVLKLEQVYGGVGRPRNVYQLNKRK
ncbi:MAG: response regulator [Tissierellales bacterium]|nr:response regulator [Tissierellales bacterium]